MHLNLYNTNKAHYKNKTTSDGDDAQQPAGHGCKQREDIACKTRFT